MKKMTLFLSFVLGFTLLFNSTTYAQKEFYDLDEKKYSWALESIHFMVDKGVVKGFPDGTFRPDDQVSKAEFVAMISRLFDKYKPNLTIKDDFYKIDQFADVPKTHWAYKEISAVIPRYQWLSYYYSAASDVPFFEPDKKITRLGATALMPGFIMDDFEDIDIYHSLSKMKDLTIKTFSSDEEYGLAQEDGRYDAGKDPLDQLHPFLFMKDGDGYYLSDDHSFLLGNDIASLLSKNIMVGDKNGNFKPNEPLNRAQAVSILYRIYEYLDETGELSTYSSK